VLVVVMVVMVVLLVVVVRVVVIFTCIVVDVRVFDGDVGVVWTRPDLVNY
jgi:hypothetical protein